MINDVNNYIGFINNYPILFKQKVLSMDKTCMCCGIMCPIGWTELLTNTCDKLELLNNTICKQFGFEIQAIQVKEKYGTLRFYFEVYYLNDYEKITVEKNRIKYLIEEISNDIIFNAEYISGHICQECGKTLFSWEKYISNGWIGYYCKECSEKHPELTFTPPKKEEI